MRRTRATTYAATWQVASALLGYPDGALTAQLPALAAELRASHDRTTGIVLAPATFGVTVTTGRVRPLVATPTHRPGSNR